MVHSIDHSFHGLVRQMTQPTKSVVALKDNGQTYQAQLTER